jgi:2-hydroxy-6-oxo-6-(2'-aminophenyl)hexa-2,4-dienoate hydrolase
MAEIRERFVDANGIRTRTLELGSGDPVILVHGGGAGADSWGNWKGVMPVLAKRAHVFAVDMLGFGKTEKPDPASFAYTQQARNDHLIATIEALGLGRASLVGNSMGGATSLGVAIKRPDLVHKLVLMGSGGLPLQMGESVRTILAFAPSRENMEKLIRVLTNDDFPIDPAMVEHRMSLVETPGTMPAYGATMRWVAENGLVYPEDEIRKVKHKTLVIAGKNDKVVTPDVNWRFSELIENSWLHMIPRCGHWAMIERPDEFCAVTGWFLAEA